MTTVAGAFDKQLWHAMPCAAHAEGVGNQLRRARWHGHVVISCGLSA